MEGYYSTWEEYKIDKERKLARRHIKPLAECGRLAMTLLDKSKSKKQKYITIKSKSDIF